METGAGMGMGLPVGAVLDTRTTKQQPHYCGNCVIVIVIQDKGTGRGRGKGKRWRW